ncbi:hypothetical protein K9N68_16345 [Kovacikia minuta CCNUW1]|uniref:hypothetical protein n=1 Tax=Kovacikia minuta TaxID=2931930 RepID=UPI001CCD6EBA|nr:hypothetical protein [Kovacikia minuta]UBF29260.1 hypothetical protein K9N68_16345 [Kovacikia minuta CCNUW1]
MLSPAQVLADKANSWQFVELWVDPVVFPPKVLMLVCDHQGACDIYNPTSSYKLVFSSSTYEDAQLWLLEDEYERVDGRLLAEEVA